MHLTDFLAKRSCRLPLTPLQIKQTIFKEQLPLQLRNEVSGKSDKGVDISCLQEMAVMFACMKKHDFKEVKCAEEIQIYSKCHAEHTEKKKMLKQREESGQIITGTNARNLTTKQLNQLLTKHPQHNEKLK